MLVIAYKNVVLFRDLASQGLKGFISDQIGFLTNLVSL